MGRCYDPSLKKVVDGIPTVDAASSVELVAEALNLAESLGFPKIRVTVVTDSWFGWGRLLRFLDEGGVRYVGVARSRNVRFSVDGSGWREAFSALPWRSVIDKRGRRVLYKDITARIRGLGRRKPSPS